MSNTKDRVRELLAEGMPASVASIAQAPTATKPTQPLNDEAYRRAQKKARKKARRNGVKT